MTTPSTWTVSIFAGQDVLYEKSHVDGQADQITKYVYANGMRIAKITSGGTYYYLADHLGSTRKILDSNRNLVFSAEYEPFGKPYGVSGSESQKFTGEKHDDPTGLVYLRARQYDPEIGRFVSADPVLGSLSRPQTLNRYAYVVNNPLRYVDPTGEFLQIIAGAIVGGLIGYGLCVWQTGGWTSGDCGKAALIGAAVGAFAVATFGLGMAAFEVGIEGGIAVGSLAAVGAGVATGAAVGAQSYFLASILGIGLGTMSPQDLSMQDFAVSVGLGAAFGGVGGKYYDPKAYWGWPKGGGAKDPKFAPPKDYYPGGGRAALESRASDVSIKNWLRGVWEIGNRQSGRAGTFSHSIETDTGYEAYGVIRGSTGANHVVRVFVDDAVGITERGGIGGWFSIAPRSKVKDGNRDMSGQGRAPGKRTFSITSTSLLAARRGALESDESGLNYVLLRMDVRLELQGQNPLRSGSPQTTEAGAIANVAISPSLPDLVAACSRLVRGKSSQEVVQFVPTRYAIRFRGLDSMLLISLLSEDAGQVSEVAQVQGSMADVAQACLLHGKSVLTWILSTNPGLKGNLEVMSWAGAMKRLEDALQG